MIWTKIVIVIEVDCTQASCKAKKEQEIWEKYEAKLAILRTDFSSLYLRLFSSLLLGKAAGLFKSQSLPMNTDLNSPIHIISSDSDLEVDNISFHFPLKLPSSIF